MLFQVMTDDVSVHASEPLITIASPSTPIVPWTPASGPARVALVTMPFVYSKFPSIQLGTLSRVLKDQGIGVKNYHLNLLFAHRIGVPLFEILCEKRGLIGEWLFSGLLFHDNPKHREYPQVLNRCLRKPRKKLDVLLTI